MFASRGVSVTSGFDCNSKIVLCHFLQRVSPLLSSDSLNLRVCAAFYLSCAFSSELTEQQ